MEYADYDLALAGMDLLKKENEALLSKIDCGDGRCSALPAEKRCRVCLIHVVAMAEVSLRATEANMETVRRDLDRAVADYHSALNEVSALHKISADYAMMLRVACRHLKSYDSADGRALIDRITGLLHRNGEPLLGAGSPFRAGVEHPNPVNDADRMGCDDCGWDIPAPHVLFACCDQCFHTRDSEEEE